MSTTATQFWNFSSTLLWLNMNFFVFVFWNSKTSLVSSELFSNQGGIICPTNRSNFFYFAVYFHSNFGHISEHCFNWRISKPSERGWNQKEKEKTFVLKQRAHWMRINDRKIFSFQMKNSLVLSCESVCVMTQLQWWQIQA